MQALHSNGMSRFIAVFVTITLELGFAFLTGWTLFDMFTPWGLVPAIIIGAILGMTLFVLSLYVFIYREYAVDAIKVFAARRNESPNARLGWAVFLVVVCILIDSAANGDRMVTLPAVSTASRVFLWAFFQLLIFVPFALGQMVHAHVNTVDVRQRRRQLRLINSVDDALYAKIEETIPMLSPQELAELRGGNMAPLQARLDAVEAEQKALSAPEPPHPLAQALARLGHSQQAADPETGPQPITRRAK